MESKWSSVASRLAVGYLSVNQELTDKLPDKKHDSRIATELRSVNCRLAELEFGRHFGKSTPDRHSVCKFTSIQIFVSPSSFFSPILSYQNQSSLLQSTPFNHNTPIHSNIH